ncbi:MAG TPA: tRNA uridine-5-carboxymethylaminomethyl(34) synthesis enzyme MnmG [Pyrinomonadaceae bacterium]|jgi:tRNA uridine 5-carboxymethylaminomethyl modification enzyme|nr:tRNA uridine-5-carboxymethylaminomethyl(34) synthesis enzyme MnmG [Pyrinomonadaceae bacterium]
MSFDEVFSVIVIGAGHAGCEAASAAARLGAETGLITLNLDLVGQMSCNPAIGGIAKGHLVREMDALGGIMGRVIDRTGIQFRLLNRSRGPAVQSPRAQADRLRYRAEMRRTLEATSNLHLRQGKVVDFILDHEKLAGVLLEDGRRFGAQAVVVATGTFLNGLIHTGRRTYSGGRAGEPAAIELSEALKRLGFPVGRLKTGTPPRLDGRTIDWSAFEPQPGDETPVPFSFSTDSLEQKQIKCFIGYTTPEVHNAIRENIAESPLYSGKIKGIGPRYCPSIEDKVVKFSDKSRHQLFLEPEGHDTNEVYLNGFSTSLPAEMQQDLVRMIPGLEEVRIIRPGYAIEYDFVDPRELGPDLQTARLAGLFHAGQINGTTGYEEAGCQGLLAGINAALYTQKRESLRLRREESYIGVLVEDLIKQGVDEPYRIFTSRAEYRLALRYDNADARLERYGRELGLVGDADWERFNARQARLARLRDALEGVRLRRSDPRHAAVTALIGGDLGDSISLSQLAKRPKVTAELIMSLLPSELKPITEPDLNSVLADSLYAGYLETQKAAVAKLYQHDTLKIPRQMAFASISGLSNEIVERLGRAQPLTFGEARRLPGLTPGALSTLLAYLSAQKAL